MNSKTVVFFGWLVLTLSRLNITDHDLLSFVLCIQFDIVKHMRQDQITHGLVHAITSVMNSASTFFYISTCTMIIWTHPWTTEKTCIEAVKSVFPSFLSERKCTCKFKRCDKKHYNFHLRPWKGGVVIGDQEGSDIIKLEQGRISCPKLNTNCKVLHTSLVPHTIGAYPGFLSMRGITTPPGWDASPSQITPSISSGFPDSLTVPIYTPGWREALWE